MARSPKYVREAAEWRKAVRLKESTVADIARITGVPVGVVREVVVGSPPYDEEFGGEKPLGALRKELKLTKEEVARIRAGEAFSKPGVSRQTISAARTGVSYKD